MPGSLRRQPGGRANRMQRLRPDLANQMADRPPALLDLGCHPGAAHTEPHPAFREREGRYAVGAASTAIHFAGVDVSKDTFDADLLGPTGANRPRRFADDRAGHAALLAWADRQAAGGQIHFCMEATGPYSTALATLLHAAGRVVSVVNPARVKAHARACGQGNMTDPADARAIATFARDRSPRPWAPPSPEVRELQGLVRRRDDLRRMAAAEKTRLVAPDLTQPARKSITRALRFLTREADRVRPRPRRWSPRPRPWRPTPPCWSP
ncbi:MAG: hypothetical protein C0501_31435 [Isosphaera sp.]|nr:hypothetical protein [Isosphaera sp.]